MVVAQRALQREALDASTDPARRTTPASPARSRCSRLMYSLNREREDVQAGSETPVPQALAVDVHLAVVAPVVALVAELHAVRTGDVRRRPRSTLQPRVLLFNQLCER